MSMRLRTGCARRCSAAPASNVFSQEPIPRDHPLLALDNAILTPHIAGATNEVRERVVRMAVANLVQFLQGRPPQHVLNAG